MTITQVNYQFAIKRTSHGLGLFTLKPIPKGKRIIEYTGPLVSNEEVERRYTGKYFFEVNTKWSVDGTPRSNTARYINHSCRPNAEAIVSGRRVWIWSKRAIKPGEELSYDYGKDYFDIHIKPIGCRCEKCRGADSSKGTRSGKEPFRTSSGRAAKHQAAKAKKFGQKKGR